LPIIPEPKRQRFIFVEHDIQQPDFTLMIGSETILNNLPMDLEGNDNFVAVDRGRRVIYGPFTQTSVQLKFEPPTELIQKDVATSDICKKLFPYVFFIEPSPSEMTIDRGLRWEAVAEMLGLPVESWDSLETLEITDKDFETLCQNLRIIQSHNVIFHGATPLTEKLGLYGSSEPVLVHFDKSDLPAKQDSPCYLGSPIDALDLFGGDEEALGDYVEHLADKD
jgi:hypothetical protein